MHKEIISQYKASLNMLKEVISLFPDDLWNNAEYPNAGWRIAYHALYYTDRYLQGDFNNYMPWEKHIKDYNFLGSINMQKEPIIINKIYSQDDILCYLQQIYTCCEDNVKKYPFDIESGFYWLPFNKFELHIYNIRHLHHHLGQLTERLHQRGISGIKWERQG